MADYRSVCKDLTAQAEKYIKGLKEVAGKIRDGYELKEQKPPNVNDLAEMYNLSLEFGELLGVMSAAGCEKSPAYPEQASEVEEVLERRWA